MSSRRTIKAVWKSPEQRNLGDGGDRGQRGREPDGRG
jgi:hypothetical protein